MRLVVAAIGRLKDGPERELAERYRKRAEQTGRRIGFRDVEVVEIRESRAQEVGKRMIEESIALANLIPDKAVTIILDERGESLDSATLADRLGRWRDDGRPAAVFIIGGDDGLAPSLRDKAGLTARLRRRHLAASARPRHAAGADLSRRHASFPGTRIIAREVAFATSAALPRIAMSASGRIDRFVAARWRRRWPRAASRSCSPRRAHPQSALDALRQRDQELEAIRAEQKQGRRNRRPSSSSEIDAIGEDRRKLNQALIDAAARLRGAEDRIGETEARLKPLDDSERRLRESLDGRRAIIAEVLAALQRIGRHPPPAIMVRPGGRAAIGAHRHHARRRGAGDARAGRGAGRRPRRPGADPQGDRRGEGPAAARRRGARPKSASASRLLVDERQKKQAETEKALEAERQKAVALARQVDNLKDLIGKVEQGLDSASRAARAADARRRGQSDADSRIDLAALKDPGRLAPAIAFASARGQLPFPVNGVRIREFGAPDSLGGTEKGLSIATRAGAQVTAPCDGWVVYAGPFRNYGQVLILNAGGGYHVVLAGMERISVECRPVRADRGARCGDGGRLASGGHPGDRLQPAGSLRRVPQRRYTRRSQPLVGGK